MGGALNNETQCLRDMMDAIREMMGYAPLYRDDSNNSERYLSRQMELSIGDGNRAVGSKRE